MKHISSSFILLCTTIFAISTPLIADNLLDVVAEAEKTIVQKYDTPFARELATDKLKEIARGNMTEEEKIAAIRAEFLSSSSPAVSAQTNSAQTVDPAQLIFRPPLQWSIQSIEIAYDVDSVTNLLFSMESLYREEDSKNRDDSKGESDATSFIAGANTRLDLELGGGIQKPEKQAWNPLNWFKAKTGFQWVTSGNAGINYTWTKTSQWNERAQRALSNLFEEKSQILQNTKITNCHLTFSITLKNNTDSDLLFVPQNFSIPVYAGNELLTNAVPDTTLAVFQIPGNASSDLMFRANLNTTSALKLIQYMRSHEPLIRVERGQTVISSTDGLIKNAVQESIQVETVPFSCRDLELRIRKYNQGKATTVADAIQAINAVFSPAPFEFNDEGMCVSLMGISLLKSGEKPAEHRLPVIGLNGGLTSSPIPASDLNRPLSDEGLSVDVLDITDNDTWRNASPQLQAYLFPYLKIAAESGDAEAQYKLGNCFGSGFGTSENKEEVVRWYRKAAEQGNAFAQCDLGYCYGTGNGVKQDLVEAVKWYRKAAEQDDARAQCNLALCYYKGEGVPLDYAEAVRWFTKAAEQGDVRSQVLLALCYSKGEGVTRDYSEAIKWFKKAAEKNDPMAQLNLAWCYFDGEGGEKDYAEAVKWFTKAAEQGYAPAQQELAVCYFRGDGVAQNDSEAVKWYRKAAEQGFANAQWALGLIYYSGTDGVAQNDSEAVKWLRKAAEQNHASAKYWLGLCYLNGKGVAMNRLEALRLWREAAEQGDKDAIEARQRLGYQ